MKEFEQDYREVFDRSLDEDYKSVDTVSSRALVQTSAFDVGPKTYNWYC
jgi:hypothetical protein